MQKHLLRYSGKLKEVARALRRNMTESERVLWLRLGGKQLLRVQFHRQKLIGNYLRGNEPDDSRKPQPS